MERIKDLEIESKNTKTIIKDLKTIIKDLKTKEAIERFAEYFKYSLNLYAKAKNTNANELYEKIKKEKNDALKTVYPDKSTFDYTDYTDEIINVLTKQEVHSKLIEYFSKYGIDVKSFFFMQNLMMKRNVFVHLKFPPVDEVIPFIDRELSDLKSSAYLDQEIFEACRLILEAIRQKLIEN